MNMEAFFHILERGDCPSPPRVVIELFERLEQSGAGMAEIAAIVRRDPVIAAKAVKLANSVLYRGLRPAVAIEDAITRIGLAALARLALGVSLIQQRPAIGAFFDLPRYWSAALLRGVVMQALARRERGGAPGEAFTLGLLAEIGRLTLACAQPESSARIASAARDDAQRCALERSEFGFDHHQLSAVLLQRWGLPEFMTGALQPGAGEDASLPERGRRLRRLLNLARRFADYAEGFYPDLPPPLSADILEDYQLDAAAVETLQAELEAQWQGLAELFEVEAPPDLLERLRRLSHPEILASSPEEEARAAARRVLIVDDDAPSRALLRRVLEPAGYRVFEAADAETALAIVQHDLPRILILDWVLPDMDGLALCRRLRERFGGRLYIYLISALMTGEHSIEALDAGANDFFEKPIASRLLLAKLETARQHVELALSLEAAQHRSEAAQRELERINSRLREAAEVDALTGLPNRRSFEQRLREEWEAARRYGHPLACVMLDIDHFKRINDEHGHDIGDRALRALAQALERHVRQGDFVARWGGEEFTVVCRNSTLDETRHMAERLRDEVQRLRGDFPPFTLSGGVAALGPDMRAAEDLVHAADQCLLAAKRAGRNRILARDDEGHCT